MKNYTIMWTFIGNYSEVPMKVKAESPVEAIKSIGYDPYAKSAAGHRMRYFVVEEGVGSLGYGHIETFEEKAA